jgi:hypothetical protein
MMNATGNALAGRWQAEVVTGHRCIPIKERTPLGDAVVRFFKVEVSHVVISKAGYEGVRFRVNRRNGRCLTFTDTREEQTGTAGSTGLWGTRPASKPGGIRRSLRPTAWVCEVAQLIGTERAEEIVRTLK